MSDKFREILKEINLHKTFTEHVFDDDLKELGEKIGNLVNKSETNIVADLYLLSTFATIIMKKIGKHLPKHHKEYKENPDFQNGMQVLYGLYMMQQTTYEMYKEYIEICENSFDNLDQVFKDVYLSLMKKEAVLLTNRSIFLQKIVEKEVVKNNAE